MIIKQIMIVGLKIEDLYFKFRISFEKSILEVTFYEPFD